MTAKSDAALPGQSCRLHPSLPREDYEDLLKKQGGDGNLTPLGGWELSVPNSILTQPRKLYDAPYFNYLG